MNRLFKYFSIFGILLVFSAYFFRLFEVNGFVKAIGALENPEPYYSSMGIIYKIDYFFIALIMVSCLVSYILMNKGNTKDYLYSVSLLPVGVALLERIYFVSASCAVAKKTMGQNISIVNIVNIVILSLGLLSIIISILAKKFMANNQLSLAFSLFSIASIMGSTGISVYASIVNKASIHFILYAIFFLLALVLFIIEFILKFNYKPVEETPLEVEEK